MRVFATVVWGLASLLLIGLTAGCAVHWARYPARVRGYTEDPVMAQFWGAPPQALATVGAGALLLGPGLLGPAAVGLDWVLWIAGAVLGVSANAVEAHSTTATPMATATCSSLAARRT